MALPNDSQDIEMRLILESQKTFQDLAQLSKSAEDADVRFQKLLNTINDLVDRTGDSFQQARAKLQAMAESNGLDELKGDFEALQKLPGSIGGEVDGLGASMENASQRGFNLSNSLQRIFSVITLLAIFRNVSQWIREAITAGEEFSRSIFRLAVGVRALRSIGMDTTLREWRDELNKLRDEWGVFTTRELVDGAGYLTLLTRNLNLTKDQMFELLEVSSALSILIGKDMNETMRQISLAISSGYSEALQRAGLAINRVTIAAKANQLGFEENFNALTEQQRALATLTLIFEQSNSVIADAKKFQDDYAGSVQSSKKRLQELTDTIGAQLLPIWATFLNIIANTVERLNQLIFITKAMVFDVLPLLVSFFGTAAIAAKIFWDNLFREDVSMNFMETFREVRKQTSDALFPIFFPEFADPLGDNPLGGLSESIEEEAEETERALEELQDIFRDNADKIADINEDFQNKLADRQSKFSLKLRQAFRDGQMAIAKIHRQFQDALVDEQERVNDQITDAQEDFREKEIKSETDFQEKLRKLRDKFLFDLEDAVRARDARQILRLLRQNELKENEIKRDAEIERNDRKRKLKEELADIKQQNQAKLLDIRQQRDRRLREQAIEFQARILQMRENEALERELLRRRHERALADQREANQRRLDDWNQSWKSQIDITKEASNVVVQQMRRTGDAIAGFAKSMSRSITKFASDIVRALDTIIKSAQRTISKQGITSSALKSSSKGFAEGGTMIADRPTTVTFGEGGLEAANFIPLSRPGNDVGKVFSNLSSGGRGMDGKLSVELLLSPDLEARIMENSLGQFSDILVSVERSR